MLYDVILSSGTHLSIFVLFSSMYICKICFFYCFTVSTVRLYYPYNLFVINLLTFTKQLLLFQQKFSQIMN